MVGDAYPVMARASDNLAVHRALAAAPRGSVLVVSTGGDKFRAFWGEIMTRAALARGLAGLVIDAGVRDSHYIRESGFPVFCPGTAIPGTDKSWPGSVNESVVIGNTLVNPGDLVVGDDDGVVVIPQAEVARTLELAQARTEREATIMQKLGEGELTLDLLDLRGISGE
jgi:4-hydroxy-4-methyl-2-oxoglutarate aldolase